MLALTQDPGMLAALKPKSQTIVLKANAKGEFRTQFRPEIAGNYTALVTIEGDDDKFGHFSRTQTVTAVVRSVPAGIKGRDVSVSETAAGGGWRYVNLILSPRDKSGHLLGPGLASAISLQHSSGRRVGGTHDLGDGRYLLVLRGRPATDPNIKVEVDGGTLFSGVFRNFPESSFLTSDRTLNHFCSDGKRFLINLIVAKNFHLAAEQVRAAAIPYRQEATALRLRSEVSFRGDVKIVRAA